MFPTSTLQHHYHEIPDTESLIPCHLQILHMIDAIDIKKITALEKFTHSHIFICNSNTTKYNYHTTHGVFNNTQSIWGRYFPELLLGIEHEYLQQHRRHYLDELQEKHKLIFEECDGIIESWVKLR